jgi:hypothetical protein
MFQQRDAAAVADVMRVHGQQEDAAFRQGAIECRPGNLFHRRGRRIGRRPEKRRMLKVKAGRSAPGHGAGPGVPPFPRGPGGSMLAGT